MVVEKGMEQKGEQTMKKALELLRLAKGTSQDKVTLNIEEI